MYVGFHPFNFTPVFVGEVHEAGIQADELDDGQKQCELKAYPSRRTAEAFIPHSAVGVLGTMAEIKRVANYWGDDVVRSPKELDEYNISVLDAWKKGEPLKPLVVSDWPRGPRARLDILGTWCNEAKRGKLTFEDFRFFRLCLPPLAALNIPQELVNIANSVVYTLERDFIHRNLVLCSLTV